MEIPSKSFSHVSWSWAISKVPSIRLPSALNVPVKFLGVGEKIGDLELFDAESFSRDLLAE